MPAMNHWMSPLSLRISSLLGILGSVPVFLGGSVSTSNLIFTLSRTPSEFALAKKMRGCGRAGKHLPNVAAHFLRQERIGGHQQPDILSGNMEEIWGLSPVPAVPSFRSVVDHGAHGAPRKWNIRECPCFQFPALLPAGHGGLPPWHNATASVQSLS